MEQDLARLAGASHGVVVRAQLLEAQITPAEIKHRLATGALLAVHRGVYRVGHLAPNRDARYLAAVLACGPDALLRGRAAAHLLALLKGAAPPPEVVAPTERRVDGVLTRRSRALDERDRWRRRGIPVTRVASTIVDLAETAGLDDLARACHEAGVLYGMTPRHVEAVLARRAPVPGAGLLREVLCGETRVTLSVLERAFVRVLREAGLELPITNRPAGGRRVDCRWPERRLTIELDGYRYHHSRHAWELDRRREREARARGDEFRRYTYGDVFEHPALMLAELRSLLLPTAS